MSEITAFIGDNGTLDTVVHFERDGQIIDTWIVDTEQRVDDYLDDDAFLQHCLLDLLLQLGEDE